MGSMGLSGKSMECLGFLAIPKLTLRMQSYQSVTWVSSSLMLIFITGHLADILLCSCRFPKYTRLLAAVLAAIVARG